MGAVCSSDAEEDAPGSLVQAVGDIMDARSVFVPGAAVDKMFELAAMPCVGAPCGRHGHRMRCLGEGAGENRRHQRLEELMLDLFRAHDLNQNGVLEEDELIQLNTKIKLLHHGKDTDRLAVKSEYRALFREHLDPQGRPVPFQVFRRYMFQVLDNIDRQPAAQEMILEHFLEEAKCAWAVFHMPSFASASDQALLAQLSVQSVSELRTGGVFRPRAGG